MPGIPVRRHYRLRLVTVTGTPTPTLTGCVDQNITADQAKTTYTCSATNSAGTGSDSATIGLDSVAPPRKSVV